MGTYFLNFICLSFQICPPPGKIRSARREQAPSSPLILIFKNRFFLNQIEHFFKIQILPTPQAAHGLDTKLTKFTVKNFREEE